MIRKVLLAGASAMAFSALVSATSADATTITFPFPDGTPVTTIGIATFSLQGGLATGTPVTGSFGVYGALGNSPTGAYPTSAILDVAFSTPVKNVSFTFDNFGANYASTATTYAGATPLASTNIGGFPFSSYFATGTVGGSGVTDLKFNNGEGASRSWEFGVTSISFTAVPEPSTWALMLGGFGFLGYVLRRRVLRTA
ncbi:MAG TPA: PEPxxWA-CTERM sorting domain-containing protein [Caulobacteraceae bacterium]|jgi:hypothetical protein|nr:PEPxxWA-CTERM sorting domain-containing protein [Caulobacteraceae bacterium]